MESIALSKFFIIGIFLLVGWSAHSLGKYLKLPRVTLLLSVGLLAGPSVFDIIPHEFTNWFPDIAHMALAMVGFLLGESFIGREIKKRGRSVLYISIAKSIAASVLVFIVIFLLNQNLLFAILLAGIAPASAPAATLDVIHEGRAKGPLAKTILGIVALDDVWGVILFSLGLVIAESFSSMGNIYIHILYGLWDIIGACLTGVLVGIPMAWLTGRIKKGEPTLLEASGFILLCGGLAIMINVSYLIACIVLGATVANRAKHYIRPFRDIEGVSEPFLVIFFLLAGYEFNLSIFKTLGIVSILYIIARSLGFILGAYFTAKWIKAEPVIQKHIGWCLLPQAGVALGLALLAKERFPDLGESVLPLVIGTTIIFEFFGPLFTKWHLHKAGEL